jgi:hypothetical protein
MHGFDKIEVISCIHKFIWIGLDYPLPFLNSTKSGKNLRDNPIQPKPNEFVNTPIVSYYYHVMTSKKKEKKKNNTYPFCFCIRFLESLTGFFFGLLFLIVTLFLFF